MLYYINSELQGKFLRGDNPFPNKDFAYKALQHNKKISPYRKWWIEDENGKKINFYWYRVCNILKRGN